MASTLSTTSPSLEIELETTDMQCTQHVQALLDSGTTRLFIDAAFVERHQLTTQPLTQPIPIYNINSTLNKAGSIWCVTECILCYCHHPKWAVFAITSLGNQDVILGYTWLHLHNPNIDWSIGEVKISWCLYQCFTYMEEARLECCVHA